MHLKVLVAAFDSCPGSGRGVNKSRPLKRRPSNVTTGCKACNVLLCIDATISRMLIYMGLTSKKHLIYGNVVGDTSFGWEVPKKSANQAAKEIW